MYMYRHISELTVLQISNDKYATLLITQNQYAKFIIVGQLEI